MNSCTVHGHHQAWWLAFALLLAAVLAGNTPLPPPATRMPAAPGSAADMPLAEASWRLASRRHQIRPPVELSPAAAPAPQTLQVTEYLARKRFGPPPGNRNWPTITDFAGNRQLIVVNTDRGGVDSIDGDVRSIATLHADPGADGAISLAEALAAAGQPGAGSGHRIVFDLPVGSVIRFTHTLILAAGGLSIDGDSDGDERADIEIRSPPGIPTLRIIGPANRLQHLTLSSLQIKGSAAHHNQIHACRIGALAGETSLLTTASNGIALLNGAHANRIRANRISNSRNAIVVSHSSGNHIEGNLLRENQQAGTLIDGASRYNRLSDNTITANRGSGVQISNGASRNIVGIGRHGGEGNRIYGNDQAGIVIYAVASHDNSLRGNLIYDNGALAIDLGGDGITPNARESTKKGPNRGINAPGQLRVESDAGFSIIRGLIRSEYLAGMQIDVYAGPRFGVGGNSSESQIYLGATQPDATGQFVLEWPGKLPFPIISANATSAGGSSSELSFFLPWRPHGVHISPGGLAGSAVLEWETSGSQPPLPSALTHYDIRRSQQTVDRVHWFAAEPMPAQLYLQDLTAGLRWSIAIALVDVYGNQTLPSAPVFFQDTGFRPWLDSYHFANLMPQAGDYTLRGQLIVEGFDEVCRYCPTCYLLCNQREGAASRRTTAITETRGVCAGMALTSLWFYNGSDSPERFGSPYCTLLTPEPALRRYIFATQMHWKSLRVAGQAPEIWLAPGTIVKHFRTYAGETPYRGVMIVIRSSDGRLAHVLLPYAISDRRGGPIEIWVYDSNQPLHNQARILLDPPCATWSYLGEPGYAGCYAENPHSIGIVGPDLLTRP